MAHLIWDTESQAFADPQNVPKRYDAGSEAFVDTTGKAFDHDAEAWTEKWSPNRVLYLYNEGDECSDVTGGWSRVYITEKYGDGYAYKREKYMELISQSYGQRPAFATNNMINTAGYTKLCIDITYEKSGSATSDFYGFIAYMTDNKAKRLPDDYTGCAVGYSSNQNSRLELSVNNLTQAIKYCRVNIDAGGNHNGVYQKVLVHKVWLKK